MIAKWAYTRNKFQNYEINFFLLSLDLLEITIVTEKKIPYSKNTRKLLYCVNYMESFILLFQFTKVTTTSTEVY